MTGASGPDRSDLRRRTSREVLAHHLRLRTDGDLEQDLLDNYHPDVVLLTAREVFRGHDGVRASAHRLWRAVGKGDYTYHHVLADDRMAMLEWSAGNDRVIVRFGVDSYLIENGWITAQTIHYLVEDAELSTSGSLLSAQGDAGKDPAGKDPADDPSRLRNLAEG
jgi:hypothetical protein